MATKKGDGDQWVVVPGWSKFQERGDRNLPWMKVYYELRSRDDFRSLSLAARGLLVSIWLEYGPSKGQIRTSGLTHRVGHRVTRHALDSLQTAGFIRLVDGQPAELAAGVEKKRKETPKPPSAKPQKPKPRNAKVTGWRLVRGTHGTTHVPDPEGTDRP
jgi:hypothetical protein